MKFACISIKMHVTYVMKYISTAIPFGKEVTLHFGKVFSWKLSYYTKMHKNFILNHGLDFLFDILGCGGSCFVLFGLTCF